ncbi:MAG: DUF192 domain-containing protein [Zoogloeaceae bacterium]|nr:DUF192 domain-containing protein [Zoogloeaceae bacterium]
MRSGSVLMTTVAWLAAGLPALARADLPVVELGAGMFRIEAELAATPASRQVGLMNREAMAPQRGMVFVFTEAARHCMWMRNTLIPLSVAFLDQSGRILNIEEMQPRTETNHCAAAPATFALEMNHGWFAEKGIKPGDRLRGIERLPPGR